MRRPTLELGHAMDLPSLEYCLAETVGLLREVYAFGYFPDGVRLITAPNWDWNHQKSPVDQTSASANDARPTQLAMNYSLHQLLRVFLVQCHAAHRVFCSTAVDAGDLGRATSMRAVRRLFSAKMTWRAFRRNHILPYLAGLAGPNAADYSVEDAMDGAAQQSGPASGASGATPARVKAARERPTAGTMSRQVFDPVVAAYRTTSPVSSHRLVKYDDAKRCVVCSKLWECRTRTSFGCGGCGNVGLCVTRQKGQQETCWTIFHSDAFDDMADAAHARPDRAAPAVRGGHGAARGAAASGLGRGRGAARAEVAAGGRRVRGADAQQPADRDRAELGMRQGADVGAGAGVHGPVRLDFDGHESSSDERSPKQQPKRRRVSRKEAQKRAAGLGNDEDDELEVVSDS